jgi:hypothetical protein
MPTILAVSAIHGTKDSTSGSFSEGPTYGNPRAAISAAD